MHCCGRYFHNQFVYTVRQSPLLNQSICSRTRFRRITRQSMLVKLRLYFFRNIALPSLFNYDYSIISRNFMQLNQRSENVDCPLCPSFHHIGFVCKREFVAFAIPQNPILCYYGMYSQPRVSGLVLLYWILAHFRCSTGN